MLKTNIWMWKILFAVACASIILLACTIWIEPCSWVCFDKRTVTSTQTLLLRSALSLGQRPSKHTFPKPNSNTCFRFWSSSPTAGSLSHSGYGGLEVPYPNPKDFTFRKTSLYSTTIRGLNPIGSAFSIDSRWRDIQSQKLIFWPVKYRMTGMLPL